MKRMVKLLTGLLLLVYMGSMLALPVSAAEAYLTVRPEYNYAGITQVSSGAILSIYKIADMAQMQSNGAAYFTLTEAFSKLRVDPNDHPTNCVDYQYNSKIRDYIWKHEIEGQEVTTEPQNGGTANFGPLEPGLYFVAMVGAHQEYASKFLPLRSFTIPVPMYTVDIQGDAGWRYTVKVCPKLVSVEGYDYPMWLNLEDDPYYPGYPFRPSDPDYPLRDPNTNKPYDPDDPPEPNAPTEPTKPSDGLVDLKPPSGNLPQTGLARLPVVLAIAIGGICLFVGILLWVPPREDEE